MSKLDDKRKKCVLFVVSDESKTYKLYVRFLRKVITNKDVAFKEDDYWNWGRSIDKCILGVLEWKHDFKNDIEGEGESNDDDEGNVADVRESTESSSTSSESHEDESLVMNEGMVRRVSSWMENYETFEGLSNEDGLNAMITLTKDNSLTFEEAVKSKEWKDIMMTEIESIEKKKSWEIVVFLKEWIPLELSGFSRWNLTRMKK